MAVCEHCRSTLVRRDLDLENLGKMAKLAEDRSPFALRWRGQYQKVGFQLIGRLQLQYEDGYWNEWYARFDDGRTGWVSEGSGLCYVTFEQELKAQLPPFDAFKPGMTARLGEVVFTVTDVESSTCVAVQGELPFKALPGYAAPAVDLRADGHFASLDFSEETPRAYLGEAVTLDALLDPAAPNGPAKVQKAQAHGFKCTSCGAPISVTQADTKAVGCSHCGAVVAADDPDLKILSAALKVLTKPSLDIGITGKLKGRAYAVIGYLKRFTGTPPERYEWEEYLMYSEEAGYAWLIQYNGHWSLGKPVTRQPEEVPGPRPQARFLDQRYKHFATYRAEVAQVIGEFNWRVKVGEHAEVFDYIAPPYMLSREVTEREMTWTVAEYLTQEEMLKAFKPARALPKQVGVGANQPAPPGSDPPYWKVCALFLLIMVVIQLVLASKGDHNAVWQGTLALDKGETQHSLSVPTVHVDGRQGNIVVAQHTDMNNRWLDTEVSLINTQTGEAFQAQREISYYQGYDDGEHWSEGDADDTTSFNKVPPGDYVLDVAGETNTKDGDGPINDQIKLLRDVPAWSHFWLFFLLLLIPPWFHRITGDDFEGKRWADSDYGSASGGSSSSDDEDD